MDRHATTPCNVHPARLWFGQDRKGAVPERIGWTPWAVGQAPHLWSVQPQPLYALLSMCVHHGPPRSIDNVHNEPRGTTYDTCRYLYPVTCLLPPPSHSVSVDPSVVRDVRLLPSHLGSHTAAESETITRVHAQCRGLRVQGPNP